MTEDERADGMVKLWRELYELRTRGAFTREAHARLLERRDALNLSG